MVVGSLVVQAQVYWKQQKYRIITEKEQRNMQKYELLNHKNLIKKI